MTFARDKILPNLTFLAILDSSNVFTLQWIIEFSKNNFLSEKGAKNALSPLNWGIFGASIILGSFEATNGIQKGL